MEARLSVNKGGFPALLLPNLRHPAMSDTNLLTSSAAGFVDRRVRSSDQSPNGVERRQFRDGDRSQRPEVAELADAIDDYKIKHRRRFITFEELYEVMIGLGYHR
jgi:hypothetical protein